MRSISADESSVGGTVGLMEWSCLPYEAAAIGKGWVPEHTVDGVVMKGPVPAAASSGDAAGGGGGLSACSAFKVVVGDAMSAQSAVANADACKGAVGPALSVPLTAWSVVGAGIAVFAEADSGFWLAGSAIALSVMGEGVAASAAGRWKSGEATVVIGCRGLVLSCIFGVPGRRCSLSEATRRFGLLNGPGGPPRRRTGTPMVARGS